LTIALSFLTDLSRSAVVARTRSTPPPHLSRVLLFGTWSIRAFAPGAEITCPKRHGSGAG